MFKTRLLTLLLTSIFIISCAKNFNRNPKDKFSISYIGGEFDGLILKNTLKNYLNANNIYDQNSIYEITSGINHQRDVFITNIDNTSDRESVNTTLNVEIINFNNECVLFKDEFSSSQFYIYASSDKFLSNQAALKKIKKDNTEKIVKMLINEIKKLDFKCKDE